MFNLYARMKAARGNTLLNFFNLVPAATGAWQG